MDPSLKPKGKVREHHLWSDEEMKILNAAIEKVGPRPELLASYCPNRSFYQISYKLMKEYVRNLEL